MSSRPVPRIFVVDDEHVIATTLAKILDMNGFSARSFTKPLEALAAARRNAPDLLISDVAMPDISGVDLAIQMVTQYPDCKILLFSGQAATQDMLEDARNQGHDFQLLQKPVHPSVMLSRIGALMSDNNVDRSKTPGRPVTAARGTESAKSATLRRERCTQGLEEDFKNQQGRLLALTQARKNLPDGCQEALKADLEIIFTNNLLRSYEVLTGFERTGAAGESTL